MSLIILFVNIKQVKTINFYSPLGIVLQRLVLLKKCERTLFSHVLSESEMSAQSFPTRVAASTGSRIIYVNHDSFAKIQLVLLSRVSDQVYIGGRNSRERGCRISSAVT